MTETADLLRYLAELSASGQKPHAVLFHTRESIEEQTFLLPVVFEPYFSHYLPCTARLANCASL